MLPGKSFVYILASFLIISGIFALFADEKGFKEKLLYYLEKENPAKKTETPKEGEANIYDSNQSEYIEQNLYGNYLNSNKEPLYSSEDVDVFIDGEASFFFTYGNSFFTNSKYKLFDEDKPRSRVITEGFYPEQVVRLYADGYIGKRIKIYIDHDSTRSKDQNHYMMNYTAIEDDEVIRSVNAGEIDINFNHSRYAVYDNSMSKGLGVDFTVAKNNFSLKAFGSVLRGESSIEYFKGNFSRNTGKLSDYQFVRRTYYQLEPFIRYDGVSSMPSGASVYLLNAITSTPPSPANYSLNPVNISPEGFAVYLDDQNPYNNLNAIKFSIDGGYYTRLVNGVDYSVNYSTGVITFLKSIDESARIFVVYQRQGGSLDPCAIPPGDPKHPGGEFSGKNIVFIKYGYSLNEDTGSKNLAFDIGEKDYNNDGRVNLDIYEIRSFYSLGCRNIAAGNMSLVFRGENSDLTRADVEKLSPYSVDRENGIVKFNLREPFRALLGNRADLIYSEKFLNDVYIYSRYSINAEFSTEARTIQLKHGNIIENSVTIKVDKKELSKSLYSVDYTAGYIFFTNSNNPMISSQTEIEVRYQYLPLGASSDSFAAGLRLDYSLTRDIKIGTSLLVEKDTKSDVIPDIGEASTQTNLYEGDLLLKLSPERLSDIIENLYGKRVRKIPLELSFYGEYARSYKNINTFGKALIDNMESSDDIVDIDLSDKKWILGSMPEGFSQSNRALIYYYYYRDLSNPESLKGESFNAYKIGYSSKPGPFNIATGHIPDSVKSLDSQISLVFDYDFATGNCFSVVTQDLHREAIDLSGIQYIEMWVRLEGQTSTDSIDLFLDLGSLNEDSDGDGILDKEDSNNNGYIDANPSSGYSEDRGYSFDGNNKTLVGSGPGLSSSTKGDGVLNSEDLNKNGILDTSENSFKVNLGSIIHSGSTWRKIKVNINSLSTTEKNILKQTRSLRLYGIASSGTKGRLYISSFKIVSLKWKEAMLDNIAIDDDSILSIALLNTITDSDYRINSFLYQKRNVYESLYGSNSTDDIDSRSESAMEINFSIPAGNTNLSLGRNFNKAMDLRYYKTMSIWINARVIAPSATLFCILGSTERDYIEYRFRPLMENSWEEIRLSLSSDAGNIAPYRTEGNPDMRRIKYMRFGVSGSGTSGKIWLDDIYVSDPVTLEGDARWYEVNLKILKALAMTSANRPIMSDIDLKYIARGNSDNFNSLNKNNGQIKEDVQEIHGKSKVLPNLDLAIDYIYSKSRSDSLDEEISIDKRGDNINKQLQVTSSFISTESGIPSVGLNYKFSHNKNTKNLKISDYDYRENERLCVHDSMVTWKQDFENFFYGKLLLDFSLVLAFTEKNLKRDSSEVDSSLLSGDFNLKESIKNQDSRFSGNFAYLLNGFYIKPSVVSYTNEVVSWENADEDLGISKNFDGGFHFPFILDNNVRLLERGNDFDLKFGYNGDFFVMPEYEISTYYRENDFSDAEDSFSGSGFSRTKDGYSVFSTKIKIPFVMRKFKSLEVWRSLVLDFSRSISVNENSVPYEGEGTGLFNEQYGLSRLYSHIAGGAYNLFEYPPYYFFTGRGNFARGRDYVYGKLNSDLPLKERISSLDYNNSLLFNEKISLDNEFVFDDFKCNLSLYISQDCGRNNIYGIPNQVITTGIKTDCEITLFKVTDSNLSEPPFFNSITFEPSVSYTDTMVITANTQEHAFSPLLAFIFRMEKSVFKISGGLDYRLFKDREFIDSDLSESDKDYLYLQNMEGNRDFKEEDFGYKLNISYEREIQWLYDYFASVYTLSGVPLFFIEYIMQINRYNYTATISPEPYDLYQIKTGLTLNIHKNVKGTLTGNMALENYRNRSDESIRSQVASYDLSWKFTLLF